MNRMAHNLEDIFKKIREDLDNFDKTREEILPISRIIIRNCSEIIKLIHRSDLNTIDQKIKEVQLLIKQVEDLAQKTNEEIKRDYLTTAKQEYTEAVALYYFIKENRIITPQELNVNAYEYILGIADLIGELKRMVLDNIRINNYEKAERIYTLMDDLYQNLFSLDYPDGLIPGFRKKVDNCRNIVQKTLEIITISKNTLKLEDTIHEIDKKLEKKT